MERRRQPGRAIQPIFLPPRLGIIHDDVAIDIELVFRPDRLQEAPRRAVAAHEQMLAVVDLESRFVERIGAAAQMRLLLEDEHLAAFFGESDGAGKTCEAAAEYQDVVSFRAHDSKATRAARAPAY